MSSYHITECSAEEYATTVVGSLGTFPESVSFLQAPFYGKIQAASGKKVVYFIIRDKTQKLAGYGLGIVYTAPGGLRFLYCPYGPIVYAWNDTLSVDLRVFFHEIAARLGCTFVRLDTDGAQATSTEKPVSSKLARTASLQPRAEWVLDITPPKDTIWMNFHKHARYNIRLAERAQAVTNLYKPSTTPIDVFYELMETTSDRNDFGIFDKSFYEAYLGNLSDRDGFVVLVTIDEKPAAVGLFVIHDGQAHYVFAGSSNDFRKIAPAYTVIWAGIQEAKKRHCTLLNFGGVSDEVKGLQLTGVSAFKYRFAGYRIEHQNPYDIVYKPLRYTAFKLYKTFHR